MGNYTVSESDYKLLQGIKKVIALSLQLTGLDFTSGLIEIGEGKDIDDLISDLANIPGLRAAITEPELMAKMVANSMKELQRESHDHKLTDLLKLSGISRPGEIGEQGKPL